MSYAVLRVRGTIHIRRDIKDTLRMLRLKRVNHCVIVPRNDAYLGMLQKAKDYVTWGEIEPDVLAKLISSRGQLTGGKALDDSYVKKATGYSSIKDLAEAICKGEAEYSKIKGVKPLFRLHPPLKGYEGIKRSFKNGGALGYRSKEINDLILRMISPEA